MVRPRIRVSLLTLALVLGGSDALAQGTEGQAERDFEAGKAAEERGQMDEACRHYRSSLEKLRVVGPLSRSARCDARDGHFVDAITKLDELLRGLPADHPKRSEYEAERAQWKARLARLTLTLEPGSPAVKATLDGKPAPPWNEARELDPGPHVVRVDCCGEPLEKSLDLAPGSSTTLALPFANVKGPGDGPTPDPVPTTDRGLSPWMTGAIVSFSIGGASIIATTVTGVLILQEDDAAKELCAVPRQAGCDEAIESGEALLGPNLALWIVSGIAVAAGVTFVIVDATQDAPASQRPGVSAALRVAPGQMAISGSF